MSSIFGKFAPLKILRRDIVLTIIGALLGWGISHLYYLRALEDAKADAEEHRRVEALILRGVESVGDIEYSRDASGKVIGVVVELGGAASAVSTATCDLTVEHTRNVK